MATKQPASTVTTNALVPITVLPAVPFGPAKQPATLREQRLIDELAVQKRAIAGEREKAELAISAVTQISAHLHHEYAGLAEEVVEVQAGARDPRAQRWVDWFTEQAMPQAGADLGRIGHTSAYAIGTIVAEPLYPGPEEPRPPKARGLARLRARVREEW
jgi:hypothetical protein